MTCSYDQVYDIPLKSSVCFREYELDRHDKKKLRNEMKGELFTIIKPNEGLSLDLIETYYRGVPETYYPALSSYPYVRLVLTIGLDNYGIPVYRVAALNKYFMDESLQSIEYEAPQDFTLGVTDQILGFKSYNFGEKFK